MNSLVPVWRLREIRNIADALAFRAACCPLATVVMLTESRLLKPHAHIRLIMNPRLDVGEAGHYVQQLDATNRQDGSRVRIIQATIHFNSDLTTKSGWEKGARAVAMELARVAMFTIAAKRQLICTSAREEEQVVKAFANEILNNRWLEFQPTRPRFSLAELREIVKKRLNRASGELAPHIQRLLLPYLGPDGW